MVGAVGIEPSGLLNPRKLFIPRSDRSEKNARNAEPSTWRVHGYFAAWFCVERLERGNSEHRQLPLADLLTLLEPTNQR
jgi:hypothetical protein